MIKEALKMALEALEGLFTNEQFDGGGVAVWRLGGSVQPKQAITAIKKALAQPEQEPTVYIRKDQLQKAMQSAMLCEVTSEPRQDRVRIYTTPQQRPWVGLFDTDEGVSEIAALSFADKFSFAKAIESKLRELNA